ncbi:hypothetical protein [Cellulosilyticum ruminicola]|uniref:hypothetical protein n=1 Tax=Cellulosilyticum ruminicola TaxID=425254 RepID=UPI0006D0DDC7|nr:hypothetical protein [Cellulosilyticum ruminicola]
MAERNEQVNACFLGVNEDIISGLGIEDPVELYEKGQWTWDKFLEIAKAQQKIQMGIMLWINLVFRVYHF